MYKQAVLLLCLCAGCLPADFGSLTGNAPAEGAASSDSGECSARDGASCDSSGAPDAQVCTRCDLDAEACGKCDADAQTCDACGVPASCTQAHPECEADRLESETRPCGACNTGTQLRARVCSGQTCTWGPWTDWSECVGVTGSCAQGETAPCANGDSCGHRVCDDRCSWGPCVPKLPDGCLRTGPGHNDEGSNYRCCDTGHWQFCLPDCHWGKSCVACASGAPNYCSDCY